MANLRDVQERLRKQPELRFLAEMVQETDIDRVTNGVVAGVLLVNPRLAADLSTDMLCAVVKNEFRVAQELRQGVVPLPH